MFEELKKDNNCELTYGKIKAKKGCYFVVADMTSILSKN